MNEQFAWLISYTRLSFKTSILNHFSSTDVFLNKGNKTAESFNIIGWLPMAKKQLHSYFKAFPRVVKSF